MSLAAALGEGTTKPDNVVKVDKWGSPLSSTSHAKNIGDVYSIQIPKFGMLPTSRVAKKPDVGHICQASRGYSRRTSNDWVFVTDVPQGGRIAMNH